MFNYALQRGLHRIDYHNYCGLYALINFLGRLRKRCEFELNFPLALNLSHSTPKKDGKTFWPDTKKYIWEQNASRYTVLFTSLKVFFLLFFLSEVHISQYLLLFSTFFDFFQTANSNLSSLACSLPFYSFLERRIFF